MKADHPLIVHVQSIWVPLVDRNPQVFTNIFTAKPEDYRKATRPLYRYKNLPSSLEINVLCCRPPRGAEDATPGRSPAGSPTPAAPCYR